MILVFSLELFFSFFLNFCCWKLSSSLSRDLDPRQKGKGSEGEFFCSLLLLKNISENISTTRPAQRQKRRKKASFWWGRNILSLKGRQGFLSPPIVVVVIVAQRRAAVSKYRAQEKKYRTARARAKNPDIWWREEVLLGVLLIERSLCLRAFSPSNFPSEGIFIGLFFRQFFFFLVGKLPFWNLPFLSLWFFFCRFARRERRGGNQHKKSTARVRRAATTLYIILLFRRKEE